MPILGELARRAQKYVIDNSPSILTAIGVSGVITTAYLTGRASFKAAEIIREREEEDGHAEDAKIRLKHRTQLVWKEYVPPVVMATMTVSAIVCANRIGQRRAAALATAYTIMERGYEEYRTKVIEKLGEKKEQALRDEVAQERIERNPIGDKTVIIGSGEVLCFDEHTGRYFQSDMETLRKAQNDLNNQIINDFYASLTDFYEMIGLPKTAESDEVGWNSDRLLELTFSGTIAKDGRPCISVGFKVVPIRGFYRLQ